MASYLNIQASVLRLCSDSALILKTLVGSEFKPLNLDAYSNEDALPKTDLIGVEQLSVRSSTDGGPLDSLSASITIGTVNDTNNMRLSQAVDYIYESLLPTKGFRLYDAEQGIRLGDIICTGQTSILPVQDGDAGRVFQSILFQASALFESR